MESRPLCSERLSVACIEIGLSAIRRVEKGVAIKPHEARLTNRHHRETLAAVGAANIFLRTQTEKPLNK